jgi:hypothetical protein
VVRSRALLVRHPLRADDAIQPASALLLEWELDQAVTFAAHDERLKVAAKAEGLAVLP